MHYLIDAAPAPLTGRVLDHRRLHTHILTRVGASRGFPSDRTEGDDVHVYVGEHPLDGLAVGDRAAVGDALLRPLDGHFQRTGEDAQSHRATQQPVMVDQPLLSQGEPAANLAKDLRLRHPDVVEMDVVLLCLGRYDPDPNGLEGNAGRGVVDDEHRDAAALHLVRVGNGLNQEEVGGSGTGDEHLGAVENPVVTVPHGAGLHHAAGIRASLRFGLPEGVVQIAVDSGIQIFLLLLRRARPDHEHGHRGGGQVNDAAVDFLFQDQVAQGAHASAAVFLRDKRRVDPRLLRDIVQTAPLVRGEGT